MRGKISVAHLLEMYKIWQMWHLRLSYRAEGLSRSQEELKRRQNRQLQFVFLDQEFLPRLIGLVKERKSEFLDYAGQPCGSRMILPKKAFIYKESSVFGVIPMMKSRR